MAIASNGLNNAAPFKWTYADATARTSDTGFVADDVGKLAFQASDNTLWILTATTPTWQAAAGGGTGDMLSTNNLSDVANVATARTNLGLGTAATHDVPASGDATATQVPLGNDSRLSDARTPTAHATSHESGGSDAFTGIVPGSAFAPAGLTGATAASRYVGATASGAPASGTFALGDFVIDQTGTLWVCTVAGTPGTWTQITGGGSALTVEEVDGSPTDSAVTKIVFPNGTLSIASHIATYTPAGGGGSGAWAVIAEQILSASAASVTFSSIPGTYRHLALVYVARSDRSGQATDGMGLQANGDTAANYDSNGQLWGDTTVTDANTGGTFLNAGNITGATATAGEVGLGVIFIGDYARTAWRKQVQTDGSVQGGGGVRGFKYFGHWKSTAAVTSVTLRSTTGSNLVSGSVLTLYGITNS